MKQLLKSILPYTIAIVLFYAFTVIYFYPSLDGKVIQSSDITSFTASASEMTKYQEIEKEKDNPQQILWSNSLFSGMPTYMITGPKWMNKTPQLRNIIAKVSKLSRPYYAMLVGLIGVFFLLVVFGVNPWLSIIGAFTYNLASYHFILIAHGHNAKAIVIAHFAYVLIGLALVFRHRKYFWGTLVFALALV